MQSGRFIGPCALVYAVILLIGSYYAFWTESSLEWVQLKYNRILIDSEWWRFITSLLCIGYPTPYALLFIAILLVHLRTYEDKPLMITDDSNPFVNFVVSVLYAVGGFWFTCLFYPLYYAPYFIIMTLLTIETMKTRDETTDIIGFTVKRNLFPFVYAAVTFVVNRTIMNELFAIAWGVLYLRFYKIAPIRSFLKEVVYLLQKLFGIQQVTYLSKEQLRNKSLQRYKKQ